MRVAVPPTRDRPLRLPSLLWPWRSTHARPCPWAGHRPTGPARTPFSIRQLPMWTARVPRLAKRPSSGADRWHGVGDQALHCLPLLHSALRHALSSTTRALDGPVRWPKDGHPSLADVSRSPSPIWRSRNAWASADPMRSPPLHCRGCGRLLPACTKPLNPSPGYTLRTASCLLLTCSLS